MADQEMLLVIHEELRQIREQLDRMEKRRAVAVEKAWYTVKEVSLRLGMSESGYQVRQWCNRGQAKAVKVRGEGRRGEWRIHRDQLARLEGTGPSPEGTFDNHDSDVLALAG